MPYALCALRYFEVTMPAIASLEDLKAAQKEGLSIYAMLHACLPQARRFALCCMKMASHRMEKYL